MKRGTIRCQLNREVKEKVDICRQTIYDNTTGIHALYTLVN